MLKSCLVFMFSFILSICTPIINTTVFAAKENQKATKKYSLTKTFRTGLISYLAMFSKLSSAYNSEKNTNRFEEPRLIIRAKDTNPAYHLRAHKESQNISSDLVKQKVSNWALGHSSNVEGQVERDMANSFKLVKISGAENENTVQELAQELAQDPDIDTVIVDFPVQAFSDPLISDQWFLDNEPGIGAKLLWENGLEGEGVTIAVLDSGLVAHEDLNDKVLGGYDFISSSTTAMDGDGRDADFTDPGDGNKAGECGAGSGPSDDSWHGTHVAGTALATKGNGKGGSGVAPKAKLLVLRVLGKCGSGSFSDVIDAMYWAIGDSIPGVPDNENPADIINLSLGGPGACYNDLEKALGEIKKRAIIVTSAGNAGDNLDNTPYIPASCSNVFTVAATGPKKKLAYYSNVGSAVDAAAPGGDKTLGSSAMILAPVGGNGGDDYAYYQGTSMAAAAVSGAFALLINYRNESGIGSDEYMAQMANATKSIDDCNNCDFGRIDLSLLSKNFTYSSSAYSPRNMYLYLSAGIASGLTLLLV